MDEHNKIFKIGEKVAAKIRMDDKVEFWLLSEVIAERPNNSDSTDYYYLIHYEGLNRRLDAWLPVTDISRDLTLLSKYKNEGERADDPYNTSYARTRASQIIHHQPGSNSTLPIMDSPPAKKMTRQQKRRHNEIYHVQMSIDEMDATTAALERAHEEFTKIKYVESIEMGYYCIDTWYYSPYPEPYEKCSKLYICENCLKYMRFEDTYVAHLQNCSFLLSDRIYKKNNLAVFEVDGERQKLYCQNLCLLAKLFLDHKTLYYDVSHFNFYVLMECDEAGTHIVGYFSKEKDSLEHFNLSCIMVLPPHQKKGYGKFLISFSYELSIIDKRMGTPEKPLSDLGKLSYRSYWTWILLNYLKGINCRPISLKNLSLETFIMYDDIVYTLQTLNLLKYWKGQYVICANNKIIDQYIDTGNCRPPKIVADSKFITYKNCLSTKEKL